MSAHYSRQLNTALRVCCFVVLGVLLGPTQRAAAALPQRFMTESRIEKGNFGFTFISTAARARVSEAAVGGLLWLAMILSSRSRRNRL